MSIIGTKTGSPELLVVSFLLPAFLWFYRENLPLLEAYGTKIAANCYFNNSLNLLTTKSSGEPEIVR